MIDCNTNSWKPSTLSPMYGGNAVRQSVEQGWEIHSDSKLLRLLYSKRSTWTGSVFSRLIPTNVKVDFDRCAEEIDSKRIDSSVTKLEASQNWLAVNRDNYRGKWVVLDGGILIGYGHDPVSIVEKARRTGVTVPFVKFIEDETEQLWGGLI